MNGCSTEFKLLLEASQTSPSAQNIHKLFQKEVNEHYFFSLAQANGVLPLVEQSLKAYTEFDKYIDFKSYALEIKRKNFFMSAQLLYIVDALKQSNIEVISIKGPLLSQHAYQDISMRPFSDLDILVRENDLLAVSKLLLSLGYESENALDILVHPYILQKFSDISFVHPQTHIIIELHWKLLRSASKKLSQIDLLFEESINISFQNTQLRSLPLEEEFLYLCVHGAKHRFERIEWMNDLNQLFTLYQKTYNWDKLYLLAKQEEYLIPYALALKILEKNYQQKILHKDTVNLIHQNKISHLYKHVFDLHATNYVLNEKNSGIRWMELYFSMRLEQTFYKKVKLLIKLIFPLYINDIVKHKNLPKSLRFLYYTQRLKRQIKAIFKL